MSQVHDLFLQSPNHLICCSMAGQRVVVLHAFLEKSQQTTDRELKLARKRLKEVQHG